MTLLFFERFMGLCGFITCGGPALWMIFFITILLWTLMTERFFYYSLTFTKQKQDIESTWLKRSDKHSWNALKIRQRLLSAARIDLQEYLSIIGALIRLCPLLGLLGTVLGMMESFDSMAGSSTAPPRALAAGISQASISTMGGLVIAATGLLVHSRLVRMAESREQNLVLALPLVKEDT
jgi:biopolymer transport protein ExbB